MLASSTTGAVTLFRHHVNSQVCVHVPDTYIIKISGSDWPMSWYHTDYLCCSNVVSTAPSHGWWDRTLHWHRRARIWSCSSEHWWRRSHVFRKFRSPGTVSSHWLVSWNFIKEKNISFFMSPSWELTFLCFRLNIVKHITTFSTKKVKIAGLRWIHVLQFCILFH